MINQDEYDENAAEIAAFTDYGDHTCNGGDWVIPHGLPYDPNYCIGIPIPINKNSNYMFIREIFKDRCSCIKSDKCRLKLALYVCNN